MVCNAIDQTEQRGSAAAIPAEGDLSEYAGIEDDGFRRIDHPRVHSFSLGAPHLWYGAEHDEGDDRRRSDYDVYESLKMSFQIPWIAAIYLIAQVFLALHLYHGAWSFLQTFRRLASSV